MKASARPVPNAFQAYLRTFSFDPASVQPFRRSLCSTCLSRQRRHFHQSSRRKLLDQPYAVTASHTPKPSSRLRGQHRQLATVTNAAIHGPLEEYDDRVHSRKLRDDEHQRSKNSPNVDVAPISAGSLANHFLVQLWSNTFKTFTTVL